MTTIAPAPAQIALIVLLDMLATAGGVALYLNTDQVLWLIAGLCLSGMVTLVFLVPALRAASAARDAAKGDGRVD